VGQSKPKKIAKSTVIKALQTEYLIPNAWEHNFDKNGNEIRKAKAKNFCAVCAVGSVICTAKRAGKIRSFKYDNVSCADLGAKLTPKYFRALIEGKLYLTALSDKFESLCEKEGIHGYEWEVVLKELKGHKDSLEYYSKYDKEFFKGDVDFHKEQIKEFSRLIKGYERKMNKVRKKMIKFVEKEFPYYIELKSEPDSLKARVLSKIGYDTDGHPAGSFGGLF